MRLITVNKFQISNTSRIHAALHRAIRHHALRSDTVKFLYCIC